MTPKYILDHILTVHMHFVVEIFILRLHLFEELKQLWYIIFPLLPGTCSLPEIENNTLITIVSMYDNPYSIYFIL
jgi:hypothetical protein